MSTEITKPKPEENETQEEFIGRCIPIMIDEGKPEDQAAAICHSLWENRNKTTEKGMTEQTLIFSKSKFTKEEAISWAKSHDFKYNSVRETSDSWRLRQRPPEDFDQSTFRTITLSEGISAVIGKLKQEKGLNNMSEKFITKFLTGEIKSHNDEKMIIEHFISTESVDRSKDIMLAEGMTMDGWPVVLQEHGYGTMGYEPIAKCLSLSVGTNDKGIKGIIAKTQYYDGSGLTPPDNTGQRLYEKARDDFMPYFSIRFRDLESEPKEDGGVFYKRWLLMEYSQVGIPDNIEAAVRKSMTDKDIQEKGQDIIKYVIRKEDIKTEYIYKPEDFKSLTESLNKIIEKVDALSVSFAELKNPIEKSIDIPKEIPKNLTMSMEDLKRSVKEAVTHEFAKEFNKMKGKVV